jgi:hypothetical protein
MDHELHVERQYDRFLHKKEEHKTKNDMDLNIPVKIVWNACSTFVESNADVSINETPFFSKIRILFD